MSPGALTASLEMTWELRSKCKHGAGKSTGRGGAAEHVVLFLSLQRKINLWKAQCVRRVAAELSVGVHLLRCCHSEVLRSGVETGGAARRFLRQDYSSAPTRSANQTHSLYVSCMQCSSLYLCYCSSWSIVGLLCSHLVMFCCRAAPQMCGTVP